MFILPYQLVFVKCFDLGFYNFFRVFSKFSLKNKFKYAKIKPYIV